ncbi:hypothetical protein R1flu_015481 [Riccia fluitans]|uniref:Uncharacterized protein n=1 Tax=Riccia fluitans TaxID=41844 RepID=A0ABD1YJH2_9MARC
MDNVDVFPDQGSIGRSVDILLFGKGAKQNCQCGDTMHEEIGKQYEHLSETSSSYQRSWLLLVHVQTVYTRMLSVDLAIPFCAGEYVTMLSLVFAKPENQSFFFGCQCLTRLLRRGTSKHKGPLRSYDDRCAIGDGVVERTNGASTISSIATCLRLAALKRFNGSWKLLVDVRDGASSQSHLAAGCLRIGRVLVLLWSSPQQDRIQRGSFVEAPSVVFWHQLLCVVIQIHDQEI